MPRIPYLYKWIHKPSGMWYIGSKSGKNCHPRNHEKYICSSKIVKPLIKENRSDWYFEIIAIGEASYIRKLESKLLKLLDARHNIMSYNQSNASVNFDRTGLSDSIETRRKKSEARKGHKNPSYGKRGELSPLYGRTHTDEVKKKQSAGIKNYAQNRPKSHNNNISKSLKGNPKVGVKGERNGMFGKTASDYNKAMSKLKNSGANNPMNLPKYQVTCIHCNKTVRKNHHTMFHGDKCKHRPLL